MESQIGPLREITSSTTNEIDEIINLVWSLFKNNEKAYVQKLTGNDDTIKAYREHKMQQAIHKR